MPGAIRPVFEKTLPRQSVGARNRLPAREQPGTRNGIVRTELTASDNDVIIQLGLAEGFPFAFCRLFLVGLLLMKRIASGKRDIIWALPTKMLIWSNTAEQGT